MAERTLQKLTFLCPADGPSTCKPHSREKHQVAETQDGGSGGSGSRPAEASGMAGEPSSQRVDTKALHPVPRTAGFASPGPRAGGPRGTRTPPRSRRRMPLCAWARPAGCPAGERGAEASRALSPESRHHRNAVRAGGCAHRDERSQRGGPEPPEAGRPGDTAGRRPSLWLTWGRTDGFTNAPARRENVGRCPCSDLRLLHAGLRNCNVPFSGPAVRGRGGAGGHGGRGGSPLGPPRPTGTGWA